MVFGMFGMAPPRCLQYHAFPYGMPSAVILRLLPNYNFGLNGGVVSPSAASSGSAGYFPIAFSSSILRI